MEHNRHEITKCKFGRGSKCGMWQSPYWLDCSPEAWPPRQRMNRESWSLPWEICSAEPASVRNPPMDLKSPRGRCPTGVYRTRRPRSPGWSRAPGTRVSCRAQTQPNRTEPHREVFAFKSWKGYHYPSPTSQKHNLGGISWVLPDEPIVCFPCLSDQYPCLNSAYRPNHPGESQPSCLLPPVNSLPSISILLPGDWRAWIRPHFNIPGNKRASLVKKLDQSLTYWYNVFDVLDKFYHIDKITKDQKSLYSGNMLPHIFMTLCEVGKIQQMINY